MYFAALTSGTFVLPTTGTKERNREHFAVTRTNQPMDWQISIPFSVKRESAKQFQKTKQYVSEMIYHFTHYVFGGLLGRFNSKELVFERVS